LPNNVVPLSTIEYKTDSLTGVTTPVSVAIDSSPFGATVDNLIFLQIRLDYMLNRGDSSRFHDVNISNLRNVSSLGHFRAPSFEIYDINEFYLRFQGNGDGKPFTELMYFKDGDESVLSLSGVMALNHDPDAKLSDVLLQRDMVNVNHVLSNKIDQYNQPQMQQ
jgi:hypothetical protein